jgi:hypothetical protein
MAIQASDENWYAVSVPLPAQRFYGQESRLTTALTTSLNAILKEQRTNYSAVLPD